MKNDVSLSPFVLRFALAYTVLLLITGALMMLIDPDGSSSLSIGALVVASYFAVSRFVADTGRLPSPAERNRLAFYSLLASLAVSVLLVLVAMAATGNLQLLSQFPIVLAQFGSGTVFGVLAGVLLLYFVILWLAYLGFAKLMGRSLPAPERV